MSSKRVEAIKKSCIDAWNKGDAKAVASYYTDDLEYRDPNVQEGIFDKATFIKYLKTIFKIWPRQDWQVDVIMPHAEKDVFSVSYRFLFGNKEKTIKGVGIDKVQLKDDKLHVNHVYLNADNWRDWIRYELSR